MKGTVMITLSVFKHFGTMKGSAVISSEYFSPTAQLRKSNVYCHSNTLTSIVIRHQLRSFVADLLAIIMFGPMLSKRGISPPVRYKSSRKLFESRNK